MPSLNQLFKTGIIINGVDLFSDPKQEGFNKEKTDSARNNLIDFCQKENFSENISFLLAVYDLYIDLESIKADNAALKKRFEKIQQEYLFDIAPQKIQVKPENIPSLEGENETNIEVFSKAISEIITLFNIKILPKYNELNKVPESTTTETMSTEDAKEKFKKSLTGLAGNTKDLAKTTLQLVETFSKNPEVNKLKTKFGETLKGGISSLKGLMAKKTTTPENKEEKNPPASDKDQKDN